MVLYNFKTIQAVPSGKDFVDVVLSKTQRKTPTVVHKGYAISRIRSFYMRKVKYTQSTYHDKLTKILEDFPRLDDIHPFYADLINVLYDKDHYKLALGQLSTARHLIDALAKDYVRLLKYGDSLYRCKQLKRAALGRMCTIMRKQGSSLSYLEQVRQHMGRLPSIDPNTRTLLVTGYPNVGKSSFMNKMTRANVEVQPYAFTTKSLYVGHMDYEYLRWQVIDTPGILDKPLEERNTIEMQAITALAHLRAAVLYFMDISEQCSYTLEAQYALFESIRPLFVNKPLVVVLNKIDVIRPDDLKPAHKALIKKLEEGGVTIVPMSTVTEEGIHDVKTTACNSLLQQRVQAKLRGKKVSNVLNRIHVAEPKKRDTKTREVAIPEGVRNAREKMEGVTRKLARDIEAENGGAGVFTFDHKAQYDLKNDEWKYDTIPEIMDGKNIADFIDPDIMEALEKLEEEELVRAEGADEDDEDMVSDLDEDDKQRVKEIREKKKLIVMKHRHEKGKNKTPLPRRQNPRHMTEENMRAALAERGIDASDARPQKRGRSRSRSVSVAVKRARAERDSSTVRSQSRVRSSSRAPRKAETYKDAKQAEKALILAGTATKKRDRQGRKGEADRMIGTKMPKHLFSGKRNVKGKADRR
eukprot:TRINITY_DN29296_c0_g1_i1.p1 TRINITY_DN29296_c0_g1~~TRINITY_DN29296_c0_g1_i1.p1  ORF type:complete len:640 (+),score=217.14 TRINITY_DN29296_c0_g1_i1:401-2320(+)